MRLTVPAGSPAWMFDVFRIIENALSGPKSAPLLLQAIRVADLPNAADWPNGVVMVPDETGGAIIAFSDGTDWRRVSDRAIVS